MDFEADADSEMRRDQDGRPHFSQTGVTDSRSGQRGGDVRGDFHGRDLFEREVQL
jgi:hypothetical protein